jgi:hypothetical protein
MGRSPDPKVQRQANLRRRLAALRQHDAARDPETGKSAIAQKGGRIGGPRRAAQLGNDPRIWSLEMNGRRWGWHAGGDERSA